MYINSLAECLEYQKESKSTGITFMINDQNENFMSYKELYKKAKKIASYLKQRCKPNSEILIQIQDTQQFIYAFWGIVFANCIPIIFPFEHKNIKNNLKYIENIWTQFLSPYLLTTEDIKQNLSHILDDKVLSVSQLESSEDSNNEACVFKDSKNDIAIIEYSSGTTGNPKGVILSNENIICNINQIIERWNFKSTDSSINWLSLTHGISLFALHIIPLYLGANQYHLDTGIFFENPILWINIISKKKITTSATPNFGLKHFLGFFQNSLNYGWDLSNFRILINGAESVSLELCERFAENMAKYNMKREVIYPSYGMTEATLAISLPELNTNFSGVYVEKESLDIGKKVRIVPKSPEGIWIANVGKSLRSCDIRVCDLEDKRLPEGVMGQLQIKGDNITKGYYKNKLLTEQSFAKDHWLRTGDLAFVYKNSIYIVGRVDDMVTINGVNVFLFDIEQGILEGNIENLLDFAACSVFDDDQDTHCIIVFYKTGTKNKESKDKIEKNIRDIVWKKNHIHIKTIIEIDDIPMTASGKIKRNTLSQICRSREKCESEKKYVLLDYNTIQERIKQLCCDVFEIDHIEIKDRFFDIGADSKSILRLCELMNEKNMPVTVLEIFENCNVQKLSNLLYLKMNNKNRGHFGYCKFPEKYYRKILKENKVRRKSVNMILRDSESNFSLDEVIYLAYAIALFKVFECKDVYINSVNSHECIFKQNRLKLNEKMELESIISDIKNEETIFQYNIDEMKNINKIKRNNQVNVLLYKESLKMQDVDVENYFQIILYYEMQNEKLLFNVDYHSIYFEDDMINELLEYILYIIKLILKLK